MSSFSLYYFASKRFYLAPYYSLQPEGGGRNQFKFHICFILIYPGEHIPGIF